MMKKSISMLLTVIMILTAGLAMAGAGDQALLILGDGAYMNGSLQNVLLAGNKVYLFIQGLEESLQVYDLETGDTQTWDLQEMTDRMRGFTVSDETQTAEAGAESVELWTEDVYGWFALDGEIYGLVVRTLSTGDENRVDGGHVRKLTLAEGKADLEETDSYTLDWSGMIETAGTWRGSRYINSCAARDGKLYTSSWDDSGNQAMQIFDLATGEMTERIIPDLNEFTLTADGRVLISQYHWDEVSSMDVRFYDPETESMEDLARFSLDEGSVGMFAWQPETDTFYFLRNGEIFAAAGRDVANAQPVNECPISGRLFAQMTVDGRLLIWSYNAAFLRNTDPALRSETAIRVRPYTWTQGLDSAAYSFASEHPEIAVIREDYGDENTLLQAMMNRDSSVDVYLISVDSSAFSAILDRGFAADLSGDGKLVAAVDQMYPFVKETLSRNGKLMAIPLSLNGNGLGYSPKTLEKLGMTEADIPKTWDQFLDFLAALPEKTAGTEFRPFEFYTYRDDLTMGLMRMMLIQYSMTREDAAMNTDELRNLLERLQTIDFDALGIMTEEEISRAEEEGRYQELGGEKEALFTTYADVGVGAYQSMEPLPLSLREGEEPLLPVYMSAAFVNPYSEHANEAMTFLESLADHLDTTSKYSLYLDQDEPVRYPGHEETKKYLEKLIGQARKSLESAEDEETRETWESILADYQKTLEEYDDTNWMISPEGIAQYQSRVQYLRPLTWNFFSAIYNMEGGEQFWELQSGFAQGTTTARELLTFIDKKVQMMRLEGN